MWVCGQKEKFQLWHNDIAIGFSLSQLRLSKHLSFIVLLTTMWLEEELPLTIMLCSCQALIMMVVVNFPKVKGPQHANSSMAWLVWYYAQVWPRWRESYMYSWSKVYNTTAHSQCKLAWLHGWWLVTEVSNLCRRTVLFIAFSQSHTHTIFNTR